jgi:hypothetical protein
MTGGGHRQLSHFAWRVPSSVVGLLIAIVLLAVAVAPPAAAREQAPPAAEAVIEAASRYLGRPYLLGTEGPDRFDCSGLIFRAFSDAGRESLIGGRRIRAAGYMRWFASQGRFTTDSARLRRGDLVMYEHGKHIAIYLGDGKALSAVLSGVTIHRLHGLTQQVTGFLRVDWRGEGAEVGDPLELPAVDEPAEEPAELVPASAWSPAFDGAAAQAGRPPGVERPDMRTAASRTFLQRDGSFVTELFSEPIHYQPGPDQPWLPIDLRFDGLALAGAAVSVRLADAGRRGSFAVLGMGGHQLGLGATGVARGAAVSPRLGGDGHYADYAGLFGGRAGLRLFPRGDGLKLFLVLPDQPSTDSFELRLDAGDLAARADDRRIQLSDADGSLVASIGRPIAISSSDGHGRGGGISTDAVALRLATEGDQPRIVLELDQSYLSRASYPIYVDLTIRAAATAETGSGFVLSSRPESAFDAFQRPEWPAYPELWHGRLPGREAYSEAYLRFADLVRELGEVQIDGAWLRLFPYWQQGSQAPTLVGTPLEEWQAETLSWLNRPPAQELGILSSDAGQWSELDLTEHLRAVLAGLPDRGYVLHANDIGGRAWKRLAGPGSGGPGALEPRLVVHWSGLRPTADGVDVTDGWDGTVSWSHPAVAPAPWRFEVELVGDEFGSTIRSGVIKGEPGRSSSWRVPLHELATLERYTWRVRVRYGRDLPWSDWSEPVSLIPAGGAGSDQAEALGQEQHAEHNERARGE